MGSNDRWQDPFEEEGITLGPEERLQREIERSKALKVERLRLKDEVEKLRTQNARLNERIEDLEQERDRLHAHFDQVSPGSSPRSPRPSSPARPVLPARWAISILIFNIGALGFILYFLTQK